MCKCKDEKCIIKIKKVHDQARIPKKAHSGDAAFDLYSVVNISILPGERAIIDTGLQMETNEKWKLSIKSRSGLASKGIKVANSPGLVDSYIYRGNILVILENHSASTFVVNIGDRIAQMEPERSYEAELIETQELSETERGSNGCGSSGVK